MESTTSPEHVRTQQIEEARRTLHLPADRPRNDIRQYHPPADPRTRDPAFRPPGRTKNKSGAVGHEAFLKALVATGATVVVRLVGDGGEIRGVIKHADKYTLTVRHDDGGDDGMIEEVFFKHDISSFYSATPKAADTEANGNV